MIKAVIYDVDGTMVNSEPLHVAAWDKTLQLYNYHLEDLSEEFQATMAGRKPIVIAQGMVEDLKIPVDPETFLQKKTELFMYMIKTNLQEMPGVIDSVKRFYIDGYRLGIGTSLTEDYITKVLDSFKLHEYFDIIVTGDEIKNGKPHPETYLIVAQKLGVKAEECIVIEDAKSGIQAAKAAGCFCIAVKNPDALPQDTTQADFVLSSLNEITDEFIKKLNHTSNP